MKQQFIVLSLTSLTQFLRHQPDDVKSMAFLAFVLFTVDFFLGIMAALACKEFRSSKMRMKWSLKLLIYFGLVCLGYMATILSGYWQAIMGIYGFIVTCEGSSTIEKIVKMQVYGGIAMGPFARAIALIAPYFDIPNGVGAEQGHTIVTHTAVMSNNPREPEIHVVETDTVAMRRPAAAAPNDTPVS